MRCGIHVEEDSGINMDAMLLREQILALGLTLTEEGIITDGMADYGAMDEKTIRSVKDVRIAIATVDHLEFNETMGRLTVVLDGGATRGFDAGFMDRDGKAKNVSPSFAQSLAPRTGGDFSVLSGGTMKCPRTVSALNAIFDVLYPDWSDHMYYDELSETEIIDMAMLGQPQLGLRHVDDTVMALYHENLEIRLRSMGFDISHPPSVVVKDEAFTIRIMSNSRNPFREWVESLTWDGVPRIDTLFRNLFGATTLALEGEEDDRYLAAVARAWLLGAISRMYRPTQHDVVPIFIGGQGAGKTRALRYIAGKDEWYRSTSMQMSSKELQRFLDSVRGGVIVELGEATQLENTSPEMAKQFISQDSDHIRKAYARREQVYPRHFIMAATSNKSEVFSDPTGNRRFFPVMCRPERQLMIFSVDDRSVGGYEVEQVWAEALVLYNKGEKPTLSREDMILAERVQDFYTRDSPHVQSVDEWLDDPANGLVKVGSKISREGLMFAMFGDPEEGSPAWRTAESAITKWSEGTRTWIKCRTFKETRLPEPKNYRGWTRTILPNSEITKVTFAMVSSGKSDREMQWAKDVVDFRRLVVRYDMRAGGMVPEGCLSPKMLTYFAKLGFLTEVNVPGKGTIYRVAWIP